MKALIYDIEIVKAIPPKDPACRVDNIEYCKGWHDHANMGVSVIAAYDYLEKRYRVFCADNLAEFADISRDRLMIGYNNIPFDNKVLTHVLSEAKILANLANDNCYDLLREIWVAERLSPDFSYPSHIGYGLDAVCKQNFGGSKTGNGANAPVDWQDGRIGSVIDYCLNDVALTKRLFDVVLAGRVIISPKTGEPLILRSPIL